MLFSWQNFIGFPGFRSPVAPQATTPPNIPVPRFLRKLRAFPDFVPRYFMQAATPPNFPVACSFLFLRGFPVCVPGLSCRSKRRQTFRSLVPSGFSRLSRLSFCGLSLQPEGHQAAAIQSYNFWGPKEPISSVLPPKPAYFIVFYRV